MVTAVKLGLKFSLLTIYVHMWIIAEGCGWDANVGIVLDLVLLKLETCWYLQICLGGMGTLLKRILVLVLNNITS